MNGPDVIAAMDDATLYKQFYNVVRTLEQLKLNEEQLRKNLRMVNEEINKREGQGEESEEAADSG